MNSEQIVEAIMAYLSRESADKAVGLGVTDDLFEKAVLDSLQIISLVVFLEGQFGITLSHDDLNEDNFRSVQTIASLVARTAAQ